MTKDQRLIKKIIVSAGVLFSPFIIFSSAGAQNISVSNNKSAASIQSLKKSENTKIIPTVNLGKSVNNQKTLLAQSNVNLEQSNTQSSETPLNLLPIDNSESSTNTQGMDQITNVSQLSDIQPSDWAYEALRSLVERYGCIAGYPNGTFRGNKALSRYEFAAGLNACLRQVEKLIASNTADFATKNDLATLKSLTDQFSAELATLGTRTDKIESRTDFLEKHNFSTTTKLTGEALFSLQSDFTGSSQRSFNSNLNSFALGLLKGFYGDAGRETTLGYRVRLGLNTSFTGKDLLLVRLNAQNTPLYRDSRYTNMGALQPDSTTGIANNSQVIIDTASYTFPFHKNGTVHIIATGGKLNDFAPTLNALDYNGAGLGSISEFGQYNPIYRLSGAGAGIGLDYKFSDEVRLSLGYLGGNRISASNPNSGNGLFNGSYGAIAQLTLNLSKSVDLGFSYVRSYFTAADVAAINPGLGGGVGSHYADIILGEAPVTLNSYGFETSFHISPKFQLSGWLGFSDVTNKTNGTNPFRETVATAGSKGTIMNWAVTFAFPDLFKQGGLGGIVFGQPPKATSSNATSGFLNIPGTNFEDTAGDSFHIEGFYRYPVTDNISITPGLVLITNPEYNSSNPTIIMGTLRTTFSF